MTEVKYSKCKLRDAELTVKGVFEDDYTELRYYHPMTGQECKHIEQILYGWSESENQGDWNQLIREIEKDDMLVQKIYDDMEIIQY